MTNITVSLPDDLAQAARSAGLLTPEAIESLLREAMKKRQVDELFATMDKLAALEPELSEEEITKGSSECLTRALSRSARSAQQRPPGYRYASCGRRSKPMRSQNRGLRS